MKKLYILCGCPGLGKSTWIKDNLHKMHGYTKVVSRDYIRFNIVGEDEEYFSKENQVFAKFVEEIRDGLIYADNVIADATHLNVKSRDKLFKFIGRTMLENVEINAIVIEGTLDKALTQNELRIGTRSYVPKSAVRRMYSSFEMPTLEEGFDRIYIYNSDKEVQYGILEKENK